MISPGPQILIMLKTSNAPSTTTDDSKIAESRRPDLTEGLGYVFIDLLPGLGDRPVHIEKQ